MKAFATKGSDMSKTWFITGATRGLGADIAAAALKAGDRVVATGRQRAAVSDRLGPDSDRLLSLSLDVADAAQAQAAVAAAVERFGAIDVLVNNAGYGHIGFFEESTPADIEAQFATNVFGLFNVTRAALPAMRAARRGHVFNLSSTAGIRGIAAGSLYCATKFAVEGFSEALAREVGPLGIDVIIVEPGYFRTDFLDASSLSTEGTIIGDYAETAGATRQHATDVNHAQPGDPVKAAAAIVEIASAERPPLRIQLGRDSFTAVADKLQFVAKEQQAWRDLSVSTDHDDVAVS